MRTCLQLLKDSQRDALGSHAGIQVYKDKAFPAADEGFNSWATVRAAELGACAKSYQDKNSLSLGVMQKREVHLLSCASPMTYARAYNRVCIPAAS